MPKVGDVVLYSAFGRTVNAIVLAIGAQESSHQGANAEPTLTLAFIDPARNGLAAAPKKTLGPLDSRPWELPSVITEHDVVHKSHEFSDEFKRHKGITTAAHVATHRGQGEWEEATVIPTVDVNTEKELNDVAAAEATDVSA